MQTFLPYADAQRSALVLDAARLGKQRSETMIIWKTLTGAYAKEGKKGWPNHPATRMWEGHTDFLARYGLAMCAEWNRRGFADGGTLAWFADRVNWTVEETRPPWWGDADFHRSHRSNLLRKLPTYYRTYWSNERDDLPYVWPVRNP
jgi:hypothetical protein